MPGFSCHTASPPRSGFHIRICRKRGGRSTAFSFDIAAVAIRSATYSTPKHRPTQNVRGFNPGITLILVVSAKSSLILLVVLAKSSSRLGVFSGEGRRHYRMPLSESRCPRLVAVRALFGDSWADRRCRSRKIGPPITAAVGYWLRLRQAIRCNEYQSTFCDRPSRRCCSHACAGTFARRCVVGIVSHAPLCG